MPRKPTRAARQGRPRQRTVVRAQQLQPVAPTETVEQAVDESVVATVPRGPSVRTPRRPAPVAAANAGAFTPEQMQRETQYIRGDLIRLLVTMAIIIIFMVVANILLESGII